MLVAVLGLLGVVLLAPLMLPGALGLTELVKHHQAQDRAFALNLVHAR